MIERRIPIFMVGQYPESYLPLALGILETSIRQFKDGMLNDYFYFVPFLNIPHDDVVEVAKETGPGVWLFSNYVWNTRRTLGISKAVKIVNPKNITLHGGPNVPKYKKACCDFLRQHPYVDIAVRGEGDITAPEVLEHIATYWHSRSVINDSLRNIHGLSFIQRNNNDEEVVRTPDRERLTDTDRIVSPYLSGTFERNYKIAPDYPGYRAAVIETNRGCPHQCAFCDWGSCTQQKVIQFSLPRVKAELEWMASNNVPILFVADANYGLFDRDSEIADYIVELKKRYGFPKEMVVESAKHGVKRIVNIIKKLILAEIACEGIVAIQTRDPKTLRNVRRENIDNKYYDALLTQFRQEHIPFSVDLIIGLPGATVESFKPDLQYYFDQNVNVKCFKAMLLVNSPMAAPEFMEKYDIKVDRTNHIVSTISYTQQDREKMLQLWRLYRILVNYSFFKYALIYLQRQFGIRAVDFMHDLIEYTDNHDRPKLKLCKSIIISDIKLKHLLVKILIHNIASLYKELSSFACERYGLDLNDEGFQSVLKFNQSVLPHPQNKYPLRVELKNDFIQFYHDTIGNKTTPIQALSTYQSKSFHVEDPHRISHRLFSKENYTQHNTHQIYFELDNPLARARSVPNWIKMPSC